MQGPGWYEISGLAWSGTGRVTKVELSADGGRSWAEAALQEPVMSQCLTRFRLPWRWSGQAALLQSRAFDEHGNTQPKRSNWVARFAVDQEYHNNSIQGWVVTRSGEILNVYS